MRAPLDRVRLERFLVALGAAVRYPRLDAKTFAVRVAAFVAFVTPASGGER